MLPAPDTPYARWAAWLDRFAGGADEPPDELPAMEPEQVGGATAARFAERCAEAMQRRLTHWHAQLARDLEHAMTPLDARQALHAARRRLVAARALAVSELLFAELREALANALDDALAQAQRQLEESAFAGRADGEQFLRAVREVRLDQAPQLDLGAAPFHPPSDARPHRSILLS